MLKSRLSKCWWLIGRHPLKHRVVSNSCELSCKLLIYCMELGKSLLKLRRKLSLRKSTMNMTMAISRRMYMIVWHWSY